MLLDSLNDEMISLDCLFCETQLFQWNIHSYLAFFLKKLNIYHFIKTKQSIRYDLIHIYSTIKDNINPN